MTAPSPDRARSGPQPRGGGAASRNTAHGTDQAAVVANAEPTPQAAAEPLPLSAFLITRNEEVRIGETLESVRGLAGETIVVDSGSTDRTVEIAESLGARVLQKAWTGYGPHKRFAEDHCAHPWLLNLDADERVSPALAAEIRELLATNPPPGAYEVWILTVYPGEARPRPFARDYRVVRLYHREAGRYRDHPIYDRVVLVPGVRPRRLRNPLWHSPVVSWEQAIAKANRFSSFAAETAGPRSPLAIRARLPFEFPYWFVRTYLFRRHVLGGWKGFVFALNQAFMRTIRIAKILERLERERRG